MSFLRNSETKEKTSFYQYTVPNGTLKKHQIKRASKTKFDLHNPIAREVPIKFYVALGLRKISPHFLKPKPSTLVIFNSTHTIQK